MTMNYEELDGKTREYMRFEFDQEHAEANPYRSKTLSPLGREMFPKLMRKAITSGNEMTLADGLVCVDLWNAEEEYVRGGVVRTRRVNVDQAAGRLALTEFSTWYVRGLAKRLIDEGVKQCQVYRGQQPKWEPADCAQHEGRIVMVQSIYDSHRARYWPEPGDPSAFSIPFGPSCHHVIRRVGG